MRQVFRKSSSLLLIGLPALFLGCSDSLSPGTSVVGKYDAIILVTTPSGGSARNELQAGGSLTITLNSDGSTSGHLHLAANGLTPVFDADMAGTWAQNGDVVTFTQAADTFIRNMTFTIQRISTSVAFLVGDQVFSGTRINLTLAHET